MDILVIGGTRFFGIHTVESLLKRGHTVTIATRGNVIDHYGDSVSRIIFERTDEDSVRKAFFGKHYDVVIDKLAYCSNDIKYVLDIIDCDKYMHMSSTSVYNPKHMNTKEEDFDPMRGELIWCSRMDFAYDEIKRQAEYALAQCYGDKKVITVRYPFAIGEDDYTNRLEFYVDHICKGKAMFIDNVDCQMSFIRSDEAGEFIAYLIETDYLGAINGAAAGTISIREIIEYVEHKTNRKAILSEEGEAAPYNAEPAYSINTDKAVQLGYHFTNLKDWLFDLLDFYIDRDLKTD